MIPVQVNLAIQETKPLVDRTPGGLIDKLRASMKATQGHWLVTNEDEQFRAAVGAVMLHYGQGSEEFIRLEKEMMGLNRLSAALNAMQVGLTVDLDQALEESKTFEPIKLLELWRQVKKEHTP